METVKTVNDATEPCNPKLKLGENKKLNHLIIVTELIKYNGNSKYKALSSKLNLFLIKLCPIGALFP